MRVRRALAVAVVTVGLVAGCSDDDSAEPDGSSASTVVTAPPVTYADPANGLTADICDEVNLTLADLGVSTDPLSVRFAHLAGVLGSVAEELPDEAAAVFAGAADEASRLAEETSGFSAEQEAAFQESFDPDGTRLGEMSVMLMECPPVGAPTASDPDRGEQPEEQVVEVTVDAPAGSEGS